jgi:tRNA dimethylallyltransferase
MDAIYVIAGPTASGKTETAIHLAKRIGGEIISVDSMQIYRGMDIGTAKPMMNEREGIPHHLIDVAEPDEIFSAARYQELADIAIREIRSRGRVPILAGGAGFYLNAVLYNNSFMGDEADIQIYPEGGGKLYETLQAVDPAYAETVHPNNVKRVARAVTFYQSTGTRLSEHNREMRGHQAVYETRFFMMNPSRPILYERINVRVALMFEKGLAGEVEGLLNRGYNESQPSMRGIGYKEVIPYIKGECSLEESAGAVRQATRRYAKRQLTWFRHRAPGAEWVITDGLPTSDIIKRILSGG